MPNFFTDNEDLVYYFDRGLDWARLVEVTEFGYRAVDAFRSVDEAKRFYREVAEMVGEFAATEVAPYAAEIDRAGVGFAHGEAVSPPRLTAIFDKIRQLDWHGLPLPRDLGGLNCPMTLYFINSELLARADVSVMSHHGFHGGMAAAMLLFSVAEGSTTFDAARGTIVSTRFAKEIGEIVAGKAWGCMDITEPDAGSDMAALRTVGEQDADGNWTVTGQKIFITSGHGKYHFVIARTEKPTTSDDPMAGLHGLSFFLVPTYHEDEHGNRTRVVSLDRVEDKLGHHGSVTGALTFDRAPAQLVGQRGEGFKQMLVLMNNARLGVGFESLGLCEASYRLARDYAAQRPSMGKMIEHHPMIADLLDEMRTDIQGLRALAMYGAYHEEIAAKEQLLLRFLPATDQSMSPEDRALRETALRASQKKARRVTPLLKYLASEKAVEMARRAVQIHGGNGFMRDYGAEKLLRDAMVMPIYEGTSQIQSLMAMKDTLGGIMKNPQRFLRRIAQAGWRTLSARDPLERRVARIQQLSLGAQQHLVTVTATDKVKSLRGRPIAEWSHAVAKEWNPKRDFAYAMLHAERLTRLLADEAICEVLLAQARKHEERREVLERYLDRAETRCHFLHDEIVNTGGPLLARLAASEPASAAPSTRAAG